MRCLAPHLKGDTPVAQPSEDTLRHSAAQLMCILAVLKSCLSCCGKLEEHLARQLTQDLAHLIAAHSFVQASRSMLEGEATTTCALEQGHVVHMAHCCTGVAMGKLCHRGEAGAMQLQPLLEVEAAVAWTAY